MIIVDMGKLFVVAVVLFSLFSTAYSVSQNELAEAKQLIDSNVSCANLSDEQLELVGEYFMEQMHPRGAHEMMHRMMGLSEGTQEEKNFHISMARNTYCRESRSVGMMCGMMTMGDMMSYGGGGIIDGGGMMNGHGTYGVWNASFFWIVALTVFVLLVAWLYKNISTRPVVEEPLAILRRRFAKGEITKEKFEEMRKELSIG
ncbi:MAG: SHOCT domain-containing protein [Candidatus Micrarchaeota archaeon]